MARKLAPVLALLVVLLPGMVKALGLGDIQLDSYLNQPLKAEIELISATQGEVDGLNVKLASPAEFSNAGLEYSIALRKLKFKVIRKNNGKHYIQVTTQENFREPFVNFLLEINWAKGRILREYTLLIDPPTLVKSAAPSTSAITSKPTVTSPPPATTRAPQQQQDSSLFGGPDARKDAGKTGVVGSGYRTQRNDTTWSIAQRILPDGNVSMEQAMLALVKSNPNAFMGKNINRLKAGYVINIPGRDEMTSISRAEAQAIVREHNRAWREGRAISSTGTAPAPTVKGKGKLEILPPKMDGKPVTGQSTGAPATDAARLHREALLAKEAAEAQKQENSELRMRISELEAQIKNQKRLATMKDDQLAALQKKLAELQAQAGKTAGVTPPPTEAKPETTAKPEATTTPPLEHKPIVDAKPATPGTPINPHMVGGFKPVDIDKLPKSPVPAKPFKEEPEEGQPPVAKTKPVDEGMLANTTKFVKGYFEKEPLTAWLIVAAIVLIVLLTIILIVQRRRGGSHFEESILQDRSDTTSAAVATAAAATATAAAVAAASSAAEEKEDLAPREAHEEEDSTFVSDFVLSDMSDLQEGGEADPLTEADVFLAYGRFGPAENMIKEAISDEPERNDLRLKLLEIYYAAKNSDAFQAEAEAFKQHLDANPDSESWAKVVEMAEDLCPDSSILQQGTVSDESPSLDDSLAEMEDFDLNAELEKTQSSEEDTSVLDFDLGEFEEQLDSLDNRSDAEDTLGEIGDLDLDLDLDAVSPEGEGPADEVEPEANVTEDIASKLEELADTMSMTSGASEDDTQSIEANELSSELDLGALEQPEETALDAGVESDLTDLDLDDDVLGELDEVGTKLDLAKAYIDMGDPEGARSILMEVLEEGNDQQKSEADGLMKQIT